MGRKLAALAIWLMACCPVLAFDWPAQVEVGQLLVLEAPEGVACTWEISAVDVDDQPYDPVWREFDGGVVVIETRYGGILTAALKTDAKTGLSEIRWGVSVGGAPDPDPPPPDPPVPPKPTKLYAVIVYEEYDRDDYTADQLTAIDSLAVREYMEGKGYDFNSVDDDVKNADGNTPLNIASFLQRAEGQKLPRIIVADQGGDVLVDELVKTEGQLLSVLKKHGGE